MEPTASRTALVTGASRGLGRTLARRLAADGWSLIIDARGADALEEARLELAALAAPPARIVAVAGSIDDAAHRLALARAARELGGLDAIVNNAGILGQSPLPGILEYPIERLEETIRINALAPLALLQTLRTQLRRGARVLNITSDAAVEGYPGWGGYAASKGALEAWSRSLAAEHPELRVYEVDPGDMCTAMHQAAYPGEDISDRPEPEASVPGLVALLEGELPSGRHRAMELATLEVGS